MISDKSIIAVAGKGGTGKTTISGLLIKYLTQISNAPILSVDADPSICLGDLLGMKVEETLGDIRESALESPEEMPKGMTKHEYFDFKIQSSIVESKKIDLLTMGRPEGPGCYCYVNSVLRSCIDRLSKKYKYVVIDCEAGLEHLSRRTTVNIDYLFIISDISIKGVKTANAILELIENLKTVARKKILIFNRIDSEKKEKVIEELIKHINVDKFEYIGKLPEDKSIFDLEMNEESIINLPDDSSIFLSFVDIINKL